MKKKPRELIREMAMDLAVVSVCILGVSLMNAENPDWTEFRDWIEEIAGFGAWLMVKFRMELRNKDH